MKFLSEHEANEVESYGIKTLYTEGYVIAKLEEETAPASVDLDQARRLLEGVSGLAECTSGELHAELENMLTGVTVEVGQVWTGITGNRMVIREVKDGRVRLSYEDDPGDETWEDCEDVLAAFTLTN